MKRRQVSELLKRYHDNECTPEEKKVLEEWFDNESASGNWEWQNGEEQGTGQLLKQQIDAQIAPKKSYFGALLKVAALFIVLFGAFLYYRADIHDKINPVVYIERSVPDGQQLQIVLSDGSKVWLNANSKIKYPKIFNGATREVFLVEGEAYFDIHHDEGHPFIVKSKKVNTQVLGTAFNIKSYAFLSNIQVAVTRGKVKVSQDDNTDNVKSQSTILLPDEQVSIETATGVAQKTKIESSNVISWQHGNITFSNERFENVCLVLENTYKIKIHLTDEELKEYRLTAGFDRNDAVEEVLNILSRANNLTYTLKNKEVVFKRKH